MSFTRFTTDTQNISALTDRPNDMEGMTAAQLKAAFDKAGTDIAEYINNTLVAELEGTGAAGNLGIDTIAGLTATTVQAALAELFAALQDVVLGDIPNESLDTEKFVRRSVTNEIIALATILTENLANGSVTGPKIADDTLETAKYKNRSVTGGKIALAAIVEELLASGSVTEPKIASGAVTGPKLAAGAVTIDKTTGIQPEHKAVAVTVPGIAAGGTVTVNVAGVTATNTLIVTAAPASFIKWRDCGVRCSAQGNGTLTFAAESATGQNLTAYVAIFD